MKASTGGTDIVAMLIRKYTGLETGRALMVADVLIVAATALVFGMRTGLFATLGLLAKALVVDSVIESINLSKYFIIVTEKPNNGIWEPVKRVSHILNLRSLPAGL